MALITVKPTSAGRRADGARRHAGTAQGRTVRAADRSRRPTPADATTTAASPRGTRAAAPSSITASSISSATRKALPAASSASNTIRTARRTSRCCCTSTASAATSSRRRAAKVGDQLMAGRDAPIKVGNSLPLRNIPIGSTVHCIEMKPGKGAQIARSAGASAQLVAREQVSMQRCVFAPAKCARCRPSAARRSAKSATPSTISRSSARPVRVAGVVFARPFAAPR